MGSQGQHEGDSLTLLDFLSRPAEGGGRANDSREATKMKATTQNISRVLQDAGFQPNAQCPSTRPGVPTNSGGFQVTSNRDGDIVVRYRVQSGFAECYPGDKKYFQPRYAKAIQAAGFAVGYPYDSIDMLVIIA